MNVNWKLEPPSLANVNRRKARSETEILIEEETKEKTYIGTERGIYEESEIVSETETKGEKKIMTETPT